MKNDVSPVSKGFSSPLPSHSLGSEDTESILGYYSSSMDKNSQVKNKAHQVFDEMPEPVSGQQAPAAHPVNKTTVKKPLIACGILCW